jgi:hypothetical protein
MSLSKPFLALAALVVGIGLGVAANEALRPDHFAELAKFAGPPVSVNYERCLNAKGYGHDLDPLNLQEFCGVWVSRTFLQSKPRS